MRVKGLNIQFSLPVTFLREGKYFIAHTPVLDISTSAETFEKAKDRFKELVYVYFEELVEMGTLDEVLLEQGWRKTNSSWNAPVIVSSQSETIKLPLHLLGNATHNPNIQKKV